jgi:hypothetical protein
MVRGYCGCYVVEAADRSGGGPFQDQFPDACGTRGDVSTWDFYCRLIDRNGRSCIQGRPGLYR